MRNHALRLTLTSGVLAALLAGCGAAPPPLESEEEEGGAGGSAQAGGSGGSVKPATGGKGGNGGSVTPPAQGGNGGTVTPPAEGGTSGGGTGGTPATEPDAGAGGSALPPDAGPVIDPTPSAGAPYGCTGCKRLFDGKTLEGWETVEGAWVIKDGALASTGKANDIYTKADIGDARIFFQIRQISGNHKPCTTLFGTRPAPGATPKRGLGGAQFQPPNGASWDYGVGGTFNRLTNPNFDVKKWHQCEVLIKEAGAFRAACCPVGETPCKGVEVLKWTGKGKKAPFNIMMHNGGLLDEYKEIWIQESPPDLDTFLSQK